MLAEKPLPTSTTKIVSTNDGLKTSPANVVQSNSILNRGTCDNGKVILVHLILGWMEERDTKKKKKNR